MKFNPTKCVHLAITNKKTFLKYNYSIYSQQLKNVTSAKYLGVVIDSHLTWKDHINEISSKASSAKAFLKRNIYQCSTTIKSNCYKSFIRPILEYAAPVWCPFQQTQIYQIERIQYNMARFVMNDYILPIQQCCKYVKPFILAHTSKQASLPKTIIVLQN